jgi:hypothetical protein
MDPDPGGPKRQKHMRILPDPGSLEGGRSLMPTEQGDGGGPDGWVGVGQPLLDTLEGGARLQPTKPEHLDPLRSPAQRLRLHYGAEQAENYNKSS